VLRVGVGDGLIISHAVVGLLRAVARFTNQSRYIIRLSYTQHAYLLRVPGNDRCIR